jgi:hypothetical protein
MGGECHWAGNRTFNPGNVMGSNPSASTKLAGIAKWEGARLQNEYSVSSILPACSKIRDPARASYFRMCEVAGSKSSVPTDLGERRFGKSSVVVSNPTTGAIISSGPRTRRWPSKPHLESWAERHEVQLLRGLPCWRSTIGSAAVLYTVSSRLERDEGSSPSASTISSLCSSKVEQLTFNQRARVRFSAEVPIAPVAKLAKRESAKLVIVGSTPTRCSNFIGTRQQPGSAQP